MADTVDTFSLSVGSMIEEVLQEHGPKLCEANVPHKPDSKIATKRNDATRWLRKSVGVVAAKDLPAEPSENHFRMGLRSGIILCKYINKIEPGAVPKIVEAPHDSVIIPDGAPLSTSPYFDNLKNFLLAIKERQLPSFEVADLEQGGRLVRVVNSVLAVKAYGEWKKAGAKGEFRWGKKKPSSKRKQMVHTSLDMDKCDELWKDELTDKPVQERVRDLLSNHKPRDVPIIVEIVLSKLTEDFERKVETQKEQIAANPVKENDPNKALRRAKSNAKSLDRRKSKKEEFIKMLNSEKDESPIPESRRKEEKKSFSSIINEMKKKATEDAVKSPIEMERRTPTFTSKKWGDVFNEKASTDTKKLTSDVKKEMENKETMDVKNNEMEKKATPGVKKISFDVSSKIEEKPTTIGIPKTDSVPSKIVSDEVEDDEEEEEDEDEDEEEEEEEEEVEEEEEEESEKSEVEEEEEEEEKDEEEEAMEAEHDAKHKEMESELAEMQNTDTSDMSDAMKKEMERKIMEKKKEMERKEMEMRKEMERLEMEKKKEREAKELQKKKEKEERELQKKREREQQELQRKKEREQKELERKREREQKEMERLKSKEQKEEEKRKEREQKEMERKKEMEKRESEKKAEREKREMERKKEMERKMEIEKKKEAEKKKEMERRAIEDAKDKKYYDWVNFECERLKTSSEKQQKLVDFQNKKLQALKNLFNTAKADLESLRTNYQNEFNKLGNQMRSLAQAAAGYRKVVEENRRLYNEVQDLKGNIRVYCRSRPFLGAAKPSCVDCIDEGTMEIITAVKNGKETRKSFTFNRVFGPSATQALVYKDTQPLIRSVLDGYNVCIFAYGQTGSGKTFTMTGPDVFTEETMGVNYRALNDLFGIQQERKNMITYTVAVQMLEIYNEMIRDLLLTDGVSKKLDIRLGAADGINVPDANLVPVSATEDVIRLMNLGHKNRAVGSTQMNARSSRSHSCLTVHVSGKDLTTGSTVRGCMHLVDLAGSERADKTEATGDRLKEATFINKSLSALGDVIASLAQRNAHVPYRNSKLTLLLQDALGGQAKTLMFIHVSPDPDTVGETISTLKFAERVSTVELGAAKSNKDIIELKELKEHVAFLKAQLEKAGGDPNDMGSGDAGDDDDQDAGSECSEQDAKAANGAVAKLKKAAPAAAAKSASSSAKTAAAPAKKAAASSPAAKTAAKPAVKKK